MATGGHRGELRRCSCRLPGEAGSSGTHGARPMYWEPQDDKCEEWRHCSLPPSHKPNAIKGTSTPPKTSKGTSTPPKTSNAVGTYVLCVSTSLMTPLICEMVQCVSHSWNVFSKHWGECFEEHTHTENNNLLGKNNIFGSPSDLL